MTGGEILIVILTAPFAIALGAWLGRKYQRAHWRLDLPYDERVVFLRQGRA